MVTLSGLFNPVPCQSRLPPPKQLIVGILAFIFGVLTLMLPETLGQPLTNSLEEAQNLGVNSKEKSSPKDGKDAENGLEMAQQRI